MIELQQSSVCFNEDAHTYFLGEKRMSGITSLIHEVLHLGVYEDADDYVKEFIIPKAGEYGTSVHHAIQFFDITGMEKTEFEGRFGNYDVTEELSNYILLKDGYSSVANEYTVSDNERYASQIDNVWQNNTTKGIWLFDTKTNNLDYYPGGKEGLQEYLSWQLSIYARLFELQNPGLKVEGLGANWLRHSKAEQWEIERKPDEDVDLLLATPWFQDDEGHIHFSTIETKLKLDKREKENSTELMTREQVDKLSNLLQEHDRLGTMIDDFKTRIMEAMKVAGVKSWDAGSFKITYVEPTTKERFDSTKFKKEHKEMYDSYMTTSNTKESIRLTLRKEK